MTEDIVHTSDACPTFFVARVTEAHTSRFGYEDAGYHLAIHARDQVIGEVADGTLAELDAAVDAYDLDAMWTWFRRTLPRCMRLVPARRKPTFLRGVERAMQERRV